MATGKSIYFNPEQLELLADVTELAIESDKFAADKVGLLEAMSRKAQNMLSSIKSEREA